MFFAILKSTLTKTNRQTKALDTDFDCMLVNHLMWFPVGLLQSEAHRKHTSETSERATPFLFRSAVWVSEFILSDEISTLNYTQFKVIMYLYFFQFTTVNTFKT